MQRFRSKFLDTFARGEAGFTLLEMLVASSILALVIAIAMPLMLTAFQDRKALQAATDRVQSLRLVASLTTQDARFATACNAYGRWVEDSSGGFIWMDYLRLTTGIDAHGVHVVDYIFADKRNAVDYSNLHRLQGTIQPGATDPTWERDDIAGWDLVWTGDGDGSWLGCENKPTHKNMSLHLVTILDQKTGRRSALDTYAYLRPN